MKHIKIAAIITPTTFAVQILDQTHRGDDFSDECVVFKASNGLELSSCDEPDFDSTYNVFFVRGLNAGQDSKFVVVDKVENLKKICDAVREYNSTFLDAAERADNTCIEVIG